MLRLDCKGSIATLTLCRPPVNAMSRAWIGRLCELIDVLESSNASVAIVRSEQRVFSAGADIEEIRRLVDEDGEDGAALAIALQNAFRRFERLPQITIAEVGGAAFGGGLEFTLVCDLRVVTASCRLGLTEVRLGLLPGAGGTQRMAALCGKAVASRLILGAEVISGDEAGQLGLAHWVAPDDDLTRRVCGVADALASMPGNALREAKRAISASFDASRDGYAEEIAATRRLLADVETRGLLSAFLDRHAARRAAAG